MDLAPDEPLLFNGTAQFKNASKIDVFRSLKPGDPICELRVTGEVPADVQVASGITASGWYFNNETWSFLYGPYKDRQEAEEKLCEYAKGL